MIDFRRRKGARMTSISDPKPCPKRAQTEGARVGAIVSVDRARLTKSHRSELNRRPLLSLKVAFRGISRQVNDITRRITAFLARETVKSHPETVPEACLASVTNPMRLTNVPSVYDAPLHLLAQVGSWW